MSEVKYADLKKAAKELNIVLKPDVPIKTVGVKADYLIDQIKEGASLLDPAEGDVIHRTTADVIMALGCIIPDGVKIKEEDGTAEPVEKEEPIPTPAKAEGKKKEKKVSNKTSSSRGIVSHLVTEGKYTKDEIILKAKELGVPEKHARMYLRAWEKGDRVPGNQKFTDKKGILSFI